MGGHDYNNALTIFFISYALAEPVTNVMLKRLTPRVFFTGIILLWGLIMTLMGLVTNYAGLLACRFFLGLAEAGLFPGMFTSVLIFIVQELTVIQVSTTTFPAGTSVPNLASALRCSSLPQLLPDLSAVCSLPPLR